LNPSLFFFKQPPTGVFRWFRAHPMDIAPVAAGFQFQAPNRPPFSYAGFRAPGAFNLPLAHFKQPPTIVFRWFRARPMDIEPVAAGSWFRVPNCPPSCIPDSGPQGPSTCPSPCSSNLPPPSSGGSAHAPWILSAWRLVFSLARQTAPPSRISCLRLPGPWEVYSPSSSDPPPPYSGGSPQFLPTSSPNASIFGSAR
jgi:hypothetical protein